MSYYGHSSGLYYSETTHDSLSIEVARKNVGVAVREPEGFRFFASDPRLLHLDGQLYAGWVEASRAAQAFLRKRS